MKVFKFGGASVKDAEAVRNMANIVGSFNDKIGVIVSAMGKTTNALEIVVDTLWNSDEKGFINKVEEIRDFHFSIMKDLFQNTNHEIFEEIENEFEILKNRFDESSRQKFDFEYDQIVSAGETLSTKIVASFLKERGINAAWIDARSLVRTDKNYREAEVDWEVTETLYKTVFVPRLETCDVIITQGFTGHTKDGKTTTLGREGSDYSAGILAFCTNAEDVTIWKDVPGMLNADPKWFDDTIKLDQISFKEAIELSYYGASVIHPKTVKPLQNKNIPLYVKSFIQPNEPGTVIQASTEMDSLIPSFIFKMKQVLFSFTTKDFSFIVEKHLSDIFEKLASVQAKINVMQNSALNFSILLDEEKVNVEEIVTLFSKDYHVKFNLGLELITIRHYDAQTIERVTIEKKILLEQKTRETARLIVKQIENT
jgi:aspartate kinase